MKFTKSVLAETSSIRGIRGDAAMRLASLATSPLERDVFLEIAKGHYLVAGRPAAVAVIDGYLAEASRIAAKQGG